MKKTIIAEAYANSRFLYYINEIRSAVLVMHGADAHSRYFGEDAYHYMVDGKADKGQPKNKIPWDTLSEFFNKNLK